MKKTLLLIAVGLVIFGCSKKTDQNTTRQYEAALETMNRFPIQAADSAFDDLSHRPDSADWRQYHAAYGLELHLQYLEAADAYWKILDRNDEFAPAYLGLARIMTRLDYPWVAVDMANRYARLSPSEKSANFELARYLLAVGELKEARDAISAARQADLDSAVADWMEARAMYEDQKIDRADELVTRALASERRSTDFYAQAVNYYEAAGKYDSANIMSQAEVAASGSDLHSLERRFNLCLRTNYFYDARQTMKVLGERDTSVTLRDGLQFYYNLAIKNNPAAFMAFTENRKAVKETLTSLAWEFGIRRRLGDYFTSNQQMQTLDINKEKVGYSPRFREFTEYMQSRMSLDIRKYPEARNQLDSLQGRLRDGDGFKLELAVVEIALGDTTEPVKTIDELRGKYKNRPAWLTRIGDAFAYPTLYNSDEAKKYYNYALEASSGYFPAFENLVDLLLRDKKYDEALAAFDSHPGFADASPILAVKKASILARKSEAAPAVELFDANVTQVKGDLFAIDDYCRGLDFGYHGKELLNTLGELTSLGKNDPDILTMAAEWYSDYAEYKKAENAANDALDIEPELLKASVQKARATFLKGDKKAGLKLFADMMKSNPYDIELNMYYSHALASEKKDMRMAGNYGRLAIATVRDVFRAESNLWYVYGQEGRWDLATGEARHLTIAFPDDPRGYFMMGKAIYLADKPERKNEAKEALEKAIKLGLQGPDKIEAEEILKKL